MGTLSVEVNLPFKPEIIAETTDIYGDLETTALFKMLPANAKEYVRNNPHLLEYLSIFPVNTYGIPLFLSELKPELRTMKSPNLIYPVNETTFVHILPDAEDVRSFYIPIEPSFLHSVYDLMPAIESRLIELIDGLENDPRTDDQRAEALRTMLANIAVIKPKNTDIATLVGDNTEQKGFASKITKFLKTDFTAQKVHRKKASTRSIPVTPQGKFILTPEEYRAVEYLLIRDKIDMGALKPFLSDPYIEDVSCDGVGPIFIEHKIFKGLKSVI
jgi:flagellar protein FlaI